MDLNIEKYEAASIPPHMRGKQPTRDTIGVGRRNTPAHAGEAILCIWCLPPVWVYPRMCEAFDANPSSPTELQLPQ